MRAPTDDRVVPPTVRRRQDVVPRRRLYRTSGNARAPRRSGRARQAETVPPRSRVPVAAAAPRPSAAGGEVRWCVASPTDTACPWRGRSAARRRSPRRLAHRVSARASGCRSRHPAQRAGVGAPREFREPQIVSWPFSGWNILDSAARSLLSYLLHPVQVVRVREPVSSIILPALQLSAKNPIQARLVTD